MSGTDVILQAFAFNGTTPAADAVWYTVGGPDVILAGDVNGDAIPDVEVLVKGVGAVRRCSTSRPWLAPRSSLQQAQPGIQRTEALKAAG